LSSLTEQVGMCARALEHNAVYFCFIDQEPIGFNVAFSSSLPIADQIVVPVNCIQRFFRNERPYDDFKLVRILPPPLHPLDISLKLSRINWIEH